MLTTSACERHTIACPVRPRLYVRVLSHFSRVRLCATPWTVARQAPLSVGFSRQEYWSGLPCPPPGDLLNPGIKPVSLTSPALAGGFFPTSATWEAPSCTYEKHANLNGIGMGGGSGKKRKKARDGHQRVFLPGVTTSCFYLLYFPLHFV